MRLRGVQTRLRRRGGAVLHMQWRAAVGAAASGSARSAHAALWCGVLPYACVTRRTAHAWGSVHVRGLAGGALQLSATGLLV